MHVFEIVILIVIRKTCGRKILRTRNSAVNLSEIYFLKNAKKTCKPDNRDLNRDWSNVVLDYHVLISHVCQIQKKAL